LIDVDPREPSRATPANTDAPEGAPARARGVTMAAAFTAAFAAGGWKVGIQRLHDNSFLVHLTTGRWILDHGIPYHDAYSFTAPGTRFVAESWLAELVYGLLDRSVGAIGIRVLMGVCCTLVMAMVYRLALRGCEDRVRAAGLMLPAFMVIASIWSERPLAFGILTLVAVVTMVELPSSWLGRHVMVTLPIVMWLWENVHGSFALGYLYIALHLLGRALDGEWPRPGTRERTLLVATAISIPFLLANPYGPGLVLFPVALLGRSKVLANVSEWMSPTFHAPLGMAFAAFLVIGFALMLRSERRPTRRDVLVTLPFVLLGLWAIRNLAIAVIVMMPMVARAARPRADDAPRRADTTDRIAGWFVAGLVGLAVMFAFQAVTEPNYDLQGFSVKAYAALEHHGGAGSRLLTTDANAGWVLAAHFPQQHVYMDDRFDMYPIPVIDDYDKLEAGDPKWSALLRKYDIQSVIWPRTGPLTQLLAESSQWKRIYADKDWSVFLRSPSR
ncbi:MAG TPA: hypothetical protein VGI86_13795, partial [Acidimicrobiia bacterium]